jgi:hypothetical protein
MHVGNTTPCDLLAWTVVTVCAAMARSGTGRGGGSAAGIGIDDH